MGWHYSFIFSFFNAHFIVFVIENKHHITFPYNNLSNKEKVNIHSHISTNTVYVHKKYTYVHPYLYLLTHIYKVTIRKKLTKKTSKYN